jgi:probable HAF family extracellular repeat protein
LVRARGAAALLLLCVAACIAWTPAMSEAATFDLGTFGGSYSNSLAMNASGQVVGYAYLPGDEVRHAFSWTAEGGLVDIGTLGGTNSLAIDVNDAGQVAGVSQVVGDGEYHAFSWTALGGMVDLGTFGGNYSSPNAINASGQIVGFSRLSNNIDTHAFSWTAGGGLVDLGTFGGGASNATVVNDAGMVAGVSAIAGNGANHAFVWTPEGGLTDIGTLGSQETQALALSDSGQVVGLANERGPRHNIHAISWTSAGGLVDIGTFGGTESRALDVNASGQAVGYANYAAGFREPTRQHAFLWTAAGGLVDLGTLGGLVSEANAISDNGRVVGASRLAGERGPHAYSWTASDGMLDLGTLGGSYSSAAAVNNAGQVAGLATLPSGMEHATMWTAPATQTIAFTSTPPAPGIPGDVYDVEATGGGSGNPVTFSIDSSSTEGTCAIVGGAVVLMAGGRCVVAADQAGDDDHLPAPQIVQTVLVAGPRIADVPADIVAEATGPSGAGVTFAPPTATDVVDGSVPVSCDPDSGATFDLGVTTVTCGAVDSLGVEASATFAVTVRDTTPPRVAGVSVIVIVAPSDAGTPVTYALPGALDLVDGPVSVSCNPPSGALFPVGETLVTCEAGDAAGNSAGTAFSVTVELVPAIGMQPTAQNVYAGEQATYFANATGSPFPTVRWQVSTDGGQTFANIPGETGTTLSFAATLGQNGARYRAVFLNDAGLAITRVVRLTVRASQAPAVTTDPSEATVAPGRTASFHAAASGTPAPTVRWQRSVDGGATFADIEGASARTYAFTVAGTEQDGELYRAVFSNVAGSATTQPARLTVQVRPAITTQPLAQSVRAGQTATFAVAASGFPVPTVQWQVAPNGSTTFADLAGATAPTLAFTAELGLSRNRYRAVFANAAGSVTSQAARLTVTP